MSELNASCTLFASIAEGTVTEEQFDHLLDLVIANSQSPMEDLAGYIVTEDPSYLPEWPEAKTLIRQIGRDKLLRLLLARTLDNRRLQTTGTKGEGQGKEKEKETNS